MSVDLPGNFTSQTVYGAALIGSFDVTLMKDTNGHLSRRLMDGDRLVRMDECNNATPVDTLDTNPPCTSPYMTNYTYYASGELRTIRDPENHLLAYEYDTLGRVIQIDDPDAGTSTTTYDAAGNIATTLDAREMLREYEYDQLDRSLFIHTPDDVKKIAFTYFDSPPKRQVHSETGLNASDQTLYSKEYSYDAFGRVHQISRAMNGSGTLLTSFEQYDLLGRPLKIAYPIAHNGTPISTQYVYAGAFLKRVCSLREPGATCDTPSSQSYLKHIVYDPLGRREQMELMDVEKKRTFAYENERQLLVSDEFRTEGSTPYWVKRLFRQRSGGECLDTGAPAYDGLGNLTEICATGSTSPTPATDFSAVYSYDRRNRIASWKDDLGALHSYGYDSLGNLTVKYAIPHHYEDEDHPHAITSRGGQTYEYDNSGNVRRITTGGSPQFYKFDSANRLICISNSISDPCDVLKVDYDADGARLREVANGVTKLFAGDDFEFRPGSTVSYVQVSAFGERVARTMVTGGALRGTETWPAGFEPPPWLWVVPVLALAVLTAWYGARVSAVVIAMGRRPGYSTLVLVVSVTIAIPRPAAPCGGGGGSPATIMHTWILSDQIGSGIVELNQAGQPDRQIVFEPFGGEWRPSGTVVNDYFAGHPKQAVSGLYQMQARWYNPDSGTFLSVDPIVANYHDPQTLNAYSYARNNPVSLTDPTGMCAGGIGSCGGEGFIPCSWGVQSAQEMAAATDVDLSGGGESGGGGPSAPGSTPSPSGGGGAPPIAPVAPPAQVNPDVRMRDDAIKPVLDRLDSTPVPPPGSNEPWTTVDRIGKDVVVPPFKEGDSHTETRVYPNEHTEGYLHRHVRSADPDPEAAGRADRLNRLPGERDWGPVNRELYNVYEDPFGNVRVIERVNGERTVRTIRGSDYPGQHDQPPK